MKRNISLDFLRIISAFAIVVLHTASVYIEHFGVDSLQFKIANFYDSLSRFGIPVFVMISGAIFLSEEKVITTKRLWQRNILRLWIVYAIWSFAYYFYQCRYYWNVSIFHKGIVGVITGCVYASNHFWFIFMITGLYALTPFLRRFLENARDKELKYFVLLFFVFQIVRNSVTILMDKSLITEISDKLTITELSGYLGYFVLGYLLNKWEPKKKLKIYLYAFVPVCILGNYVSSAIMSQKIGTYHAGIYDSFGILTFFISVALFVFMKDLGRKKEGKDRAFLWIPTLSKDTLGVYLMHVGILDYMESRDWLFWDLKAAVGVPVISILVFVFCASVSALLRRIPFAGRYLV